MAGPCVRILLGVTLFVSAHGQPQQSPDIARLLQKHVDANHPADDRFHLGSNTKAFTATMIARLVESGKLSWTTTPLEVFPELNDTMQPAFRKITLEQLLSHHAGLQPDATPPEFQALPKQFGTEVEQRASLAAWVLQRPPAVAPGTEGLYSNAGYVIAAAMAERLTGLTWEALVTALVLDPLNRQASYGWPLAAENNQPWGRTETRKGLKPIDPSDEGSHRPSSFLPAGGMFLSLPGYGRFLQKHLRILEGREDSFLTRATVQRLHASPMHDEYALGWGATRLNGIPSSTHAGSAGSFYALVAVQPSRDIAVAVVTNSGGPRSAAACETVLNTLLVQFHH